MKDIIKSELYLFICILVCRCVRVCLCVLFQRCYTSPWQLGGLHHWLCCCWPCSLKNSQQVFLLFLHCKSRFCRSSAFILLGWPFICEMEGVRGQRQWRWWSPDGERANFAWDGGCSMLCLGCRGPMCRLGSYFWVCLRLSFNLVFHLE